MRNKNVTLNLWTRQSGKSTVAFNLLNGRNANKPKSCVLFYKYRDLKGHKGCYDDESVKPLTNFDISNFKGNHIIVDDYEFDMKDYDTIYCKLCEWLKSDGNHKLTLFTSVPDNLLSLDIPIIKEYKHLLSDTVMSSLSKDNIKRVLYFSFLTDDVNINIKISEMLNTK